MKRNARRSYDLWMLAAGPLAWCAHFLISYVTAAVHCARNADTALADVRVVIAIATFVALGVIASVGLWGLKHHRHSIDGLPHDEDTWQARQSFLGFATLLLCGLSAVAVLFVALPALFFGDCR
jgi:hypothetical protein